MVKSIEMLHITQKNILDSLARAESCRYADLKPAHIDGNVFGYHLKRVITDKLVDKGDDGLYRLTELGRQYIITRYEDPLKSAHSILLIVLRRGEDYLIRERTIQPMLGTAGFVHGEPKLDLSAVEAAQLRLLDKTGIESTLEVAASGLITIHKNSELESYSHAIVLTGESSTADIPIARDSTGINRWVHKSELSKSHMIPSCTDILRILEQNKPWFELTYNL